MSLRNEMSRRRMPREFSSIANSFGCFVWCADHRLSCLCECASSIPFQFERKQEELARGRRENPRHRSARESKKSNVISYVSPRAMHHVHYITCARHSVQRQGTTPSDGTKRKQNQRDRDKRAARAVVVRGGVYTKSEKRLQVCPS